MMALAARHVDLADVGAHLLRGDLRSLVAAAAIAGLQVRRMLEVIEAEGRSRAAREGQRLVFLHVTGVAVIELRRRRGRLSLSRRRGFVRVTAEAFGVVRE